MIRIIKLFAIMPLIWLASCSSNQAPRQPLPDPVFNTLPQDCSQAIVVKPDTPHKFSTTLTCYRKENNQWVVQYETQKAVVGPNGITSPQIKKEGDGHTPSGIYALGPAFGYAAKIDTQLKYRQCTDNDYWIDEAQDDQYNTWVTGKPVGKSYERMKRDDDAYAVGAVIQYNTNPVVKGKGSAIFFHVWNNADKPTAGCVAIDRKELEKILAWLDAGRNPQIIILEK